MSDRYQAGYRAALDEVARQARVDAANAAHPVTENALNALADSLADWSADADPTATPPASTPAPACACDMRTRLVGDGCDVCNPPAPAWECMGTAYALVTTRIEITIDKSALDLQWYASGWAFGRNVVRRLGPYPTAPEAARAAVAALRAIVGPVVEGLDRVPEIEP